MPGHHVLWTPEEDDLVVKLHKTNISIREIAKQVPNRSRKGVAYRIVMLRSRKRLL